MGFRAQRFGSAIAVLATLLAVAACKSEGTRLPALGARIGATSVSGLSSGAYMAGQFQIAHSSIVMGAGIVAGGPYPRPSTVACSMPCAPGACRT
jgi:hypothetical protein